MAITLSILGGFANYYYVYIFCPFVGAFLQITILP